MANAIRNRHNLSYIVALSTPSGTKIHSSSELAETFCEFYASLYNLHTSPAADSTPDKMAAIDAYLKAARLPSLTDDKIDMLLEPISVEEFAGALAGSPAEKALGSDGFTTPYYKVFHDHLAPLFTTAFSAILDGHALPQIS